MLFSTQIENLNKCPDPVKAKEATWWWRVRVYECDYVVVYGGVVHLGVRDCFCWHGDPNGHVASRCPLLSSLLFITYVIRTCKHLSILLWIRWLVFFRWAQQCSCPLFGCRPFGSGLFSCGMWGCSQQGDGRMDGGIIWNVNGEMCIYLTSLMLQFKNNYATFVYLSNRLI